MEFIVEMSLLYMSEKYKFRNPNGIYFVTTTVVDWIDLFTRRNYCELIVDSLEYCRKNKGLIIYAWCIMPSHIHLIVGRNGEASLSEIFRDFKKFTSKSIIKEIKLISESRRNWLLSAFKSEGDRLKRIRKYKLWQDGNHPVELSTNFMKDQRLNYLHNNPVKDGVVFEPQFYIWSSAIDYSGGKGYLDIDFL